MLNEHTWRYLPAPMATKGAPLALLYNVSSPSADRCVATGQDDSPLIETFNASR